MKENEVKTKVEPKEYVTLVANGFPKKMFEQWKADCNKNYNDVHYLKVWTDHLKTQAYDNLMAQVAANVLQNGKEEKEEEELGKEEDAGLGLLNPETEE